MKNKNGQKKTKDENLRPNIQFLLSDKLKYNALKAEFDCHHEPLMAYLISLTETRLSKGTFMIEKMLKQWLALNHGQEITPHALRYAEYGHGKLVGKKTAEAVCDLYKEEIEAHNLNRLKELEGNSKK